jgi:Reverse transcriptase (RNA-dependent DNA polymerase)
VTIYKQKGDALECGKYRVIKLMEIPLKIYERVVEKWIRQHVKIHDNQFGFMTGRGTVDAIFILRRVQEKVLEGNDKRYWTFVDLEEAFDRVPGASRRKAF